MNPISISSLIFAKLRHFKDVSLSETQFCLDVKRSNLLITLLSVFTISLFGRLLTPNTGKEWGYPSLSILAFESIFTWLLNQQTIHVSMSYNCPLNVLTNERPIIETF